MQAERIRKGRNSRPRWMTFTEYLRTGVVAIQLLPRVTPRPTTSNGLEAHESANRDSEPAKDRTSP